ncbi:acyl-CoA dehydrogenase family protein [Nocardioides hwasunensis]|uniref:Acyl-CoA dehydrogenase family protein n=1 Tax=Nocardioides hwasunensis TaxID=397258 RepID=A0ABR8MI12_9ACTN|nr:acyl-CoA dehydrogenase family protein [Nocardioides hwasunensis]MBD3915617.1 acyl-CoA dehydrogenase family protein [Nocardioides hwasunensis]
MTATSIIPPGAADEDRRELVRLTTDLLGRHSGTEHLRERLDAGQAHDPRLWARLAEAGLVSALVPEEHGGAGLDPSYVSGVLHELGRHATPEPFLETAVVAVTLLAGSTDTAYAGPWLERITAGEVLVAVRLGGLTPHVVHAADADLLLDVADDGTVRAHDASDLEVQELAALDALRPLALVRPGTDGVLLAVPPAVVERARLLAVAGAACLLAGATRALLDQTVDYVTVRHQFGRPVGSFQAVKHAAADMAVMSEMTTSAALGALDAVEVSTPEDARRRAWAAKAYAGDAAARANVSALQLHGGIGFTWEYHLHLWLKRVMSLAASYGTTSALRRELARELVDRQRERRG